MTSRELTSGFDFWSLGHLRIAVMHLSIKFGADNYVQSGVIEIFPKSRCRPPPSWIFKLGECGTFRHVDSVVLELSTKFG